MTDRAKLWGYMKAAGVTQAKAAEATGLSRQTFNSRMNGKTEFKENEMRKLCDFLSIPEGERSDIFFC